MTPLDPAALGAPAATPAPAPRPLFDRIAPYAILGLIAAITLWAVVSPSEGGGNWGWYVVNPWTASGQANLRFMISGLGMTVGLSVTAMAISITLGLLVALPAIGESVWGRRLNQVYVELVRAVPILVLILWVYYGLPVVAGVTIGVFWAGVLALALSDSAFEAEIFRAGIQSIPKGQMEAAQTVGLSWTQAMRYVILPQALRRILPPLANQFVYMLKMSALVSVIGAQELTRRANELVVTEYRPLEVYSVLVLEYLVLILAVSQAVRWVERRLGTGE